ncbi:hypothetical protein OHB56_40625 [Streptomyces sp. NBC_01635]|nr:hypothetical protein OHB56_40625 [Streptomyces sp. NBC_01635]
MMVLVVHPRVVHGCFLVPLGDFMECREVFAGAGLCHGVLEGADGAFQRLVLAGWSGVGGGVEVAVGLAPSGAVTQVGGVGSGEFQADAAETEGLAVAEAVVALGEAEEPEEGAEFGVGEVGDADGEGEGGAGRDPAADAAVLVVALRFAVLVGATVFLEAAGRVRFLGVVLEGVVPVGVRKAAVMPVRLASAQRLAGGVPAGAFQALLQLGGSVLLVGAEVEAALLGVGPAEDRQGKAGVSEVLGCHLAFGGDRADAQLSSVGSGAGGGDPAEDAVGRGEGVPCGGGAQGGVEELFGAGGEEVAGDLYRVEALDPRPVLHPGVAQGVRSQFEVGVVVLVGAPGRVADLRAEVVVRRCLVALLVASLVDVGVPVGGTVVGDDLVPLVGEFGSEGVRAGGLAVGKEDAFVVFVVDVLVGDAHPAADRLRLAGGLVPSRFWLGAGRGRQLWERGAGAGDRADLPEVEGVASASGVMLHAFDQGGDLVSVGRCCSVGVGDGLCEVAGQPGRVERPPGGFCPAAGGCVARQEDHVGAVVGDPGGHHLLARAGRHAVAEAVAVTGEDSHAGVGDGLVGGAEHAFDRGGGEVDGTGAQQDGVAEVVVRSRDRFGAGGVEQEQRGDGGEAYPQGARPVSGAEAVVARRCAVAQVGIGRVAGGGGEEGVGVDELALGDLLRWGRCRGCTVRAQVADIALVPEEFHAHAVELSGLAIAELVGQVVGESHPAATALLLLDGHGQPARVGVPGQGSGAVLSLRHGCPPADPPARFRCAGGVPR